MEEIVGRGKRRNKGFGFVTFRYEASVKRALEEREIIIDVCTVEIEKAMKRAPIQRENPQYAQNRRDFDSLRNRR